jgi:hypothetical protein
MSIFSFIKEKIFSYPAPAVAAPAKPAVAAPKAAPAAATAAAAKPAAPIDVEAVLATLAQQAGDKSNWQSSIVDLLKLLGHDSSLMARKPLVAD